MLQAASLSLFEKPAPVAPRKRPRDYQVAAFEGIPDTKYAGIRADLTKVRSTSVVLFTGGGKTFIAAQAAKEAPGRVLFLAHLDTLVHQARAELEAMTGLPWDLEQADYRATRAGDRHVVASVQSIMRDRRLQQYERDAFSLIIVDEAHHYVASSYKKPLDWFESAKVLALTATPDRKDRKALGRYVQSVAFKMDLVDGIDAGWLAPVDCRPPITLDVTLDDVRTTKDGDLDEAALEEKIKETIAPITKAALEHCESWPTVIFTPRVDSAHAAAGRLNELRPGCAMAVDGSMDRTIKRGIIARFKAREFQFLANCGVLVEGWDDRGVICMIDAAPTKSRARCVQKLGRILRPLADVDACSGPEERRAAIAASVKHHAIWIDLKFQGAKHQLVTPVDVLGGSYTDKERKSAGRDLAKHGGDVKGALEAARKRLAVAAARAKTKMTLDSYDPTARHRKPKKVRAPRPLATDPPTSAQLSRFTEFGIPAALGATYEAAQNLLRKEFFAKSKGWCDYQRRNFAEAWLGVRSAWAMPLERYRQLVGEWKAAGKPAGWRRP